MSLFKSGISWFRKSIAWSNSGPSWQERLVLALFLAIAAGLGFLSAWMNFWPALLGWGIYIAAVAVCSRQGWLKLFGPVLFYDMIRTARRSRFVIMRLLYAGLLLFVLCYLYLNIVARRNAEVNTFFYGVLVFAVFVIILVSLIALLRFATSHWARGIILTLIALGAVLFFLSFWFFDTNQAQPTNRRETAVLAEAFFAAFMIVQLIMVALLTPAYVAGAIAEEKDRKTLEFMLATDLSNHEIILSKLLSRLANIALFLVTGLPILSLLQFLGGVDAELMLMGFAGTGLMLLGVASVSILFSTLLQKPRDAIGLTYLSLITYAALATTGKVCHLQGAWFMAYGIGFDGTELNLSDVSRVLNAGNPIAAIIDISFAIQRASLMTDLPAILADFAWFHGILSVVCIVWSIARLRAIALKQTVAGTTQKRGWWGRDRPAIGDAPMLWKELQIDGGTKMNWVAWIVAGILVLMTVGPGLALVVAHGWDWVIDDGARWHRFAEEMNVWFRIAGACVTALMLLRIAVHASTCISGERERDTFDALLTTPLSSEEIFRAKLLGCLSNTRMSWLWFGSMTAIAVGSGGVHVLAVPILVVAWSIYATFFAMIGLWFSMVCKSSARATVCTVLAALFCGGGHWLLGAFCCYIPLAWSRASSENVDILVRFQVGMTPPLAIAFCSYTSRDLADGFGRHQVGEFIPLCLVGLLVWAGACACLWYGLLLPKFRAITRREAMIPYAKIP